MSNFKTTMKLITNIIIYFTTSVDDENIQNDEIQCVDSQNRDGDLGPTSQHVYTQSLRLIRPRKPGARFRKSIINVDALGRCVDSLVKSIQNHKNQ